MKSRGSLLLVILLLAFCYACFAQAPGDNKGREAVSSPRADSADTVTDKDNDVLQLGTAQETFQRALEHARNNELEEAIADCTEAIRLDPKNTEYLITRAKFYQETGSFDKGLEDADKILEAEPNELRARVMRGKLLELSGNSEKALIEFNIAVERNPTSVPALVERNAYFQRQRQRDMALADADRIIQLQPGSFLGYMVHGETQWTFGEREQSLNYRPWIPQPNSQVWQVYEDRSKTCMIKGDYIGAVEELETALKFAPDNATLHDLRGGLYFDMGEYEKALSYMERAVGLHPEAYSSKAILARILAECPDERIRNGKRATEYAAEALKLAPNDPRVWLACSSAAAENGNFEEAIKWQHRLIASPAVFADQRWECEERLAAYKEKKPFRDKQAVLMYIKVNEAIDANSKGNFDRAIALASEVIAINPKKTGARIARGFAYNQLKKYDQAITDLTVAIEEKPKEAEAYFYRSDAFYKTRNYAGAIEDLQMLETVSSDGMVDACNSLAWIFATCPEDQFRDGNKAAEYIDRALEGRPNDPGFWDTCAAVSAENDEFDNAIEWEQACLDSTDIPEALRRDFEKRLSLYQQHLPYREKPDTQLIEPAPSAALAEPKK